jgi:carbon-monoxide dehydrogenase medium subunit
MKPAPFELHRPSRLEDALTLLSAHADDAKLIAGGQSLVPVMNLRLATPRLLIDLACIETLRGISVKGDRLVIGAAVRQAELLKDPLVAQHAPLLRAATQHVGHVQTRARGTIGGSVAHADPAAELPTALVALRATMTARSVRGARDIPATGFFTGALTTALAHDEILCAISVPCAPAATRVAFREIARRHGDFAVASAAVQRSGRDRTIAAALGGVLPAPHLCGDLSGAISGGRLDHARLAAEIAEKLRALGPMSDVFASGEYRLRIATVLLTEALEVVLNDD